jgi:hypothetical protein
VVSDLHVILHDHYKDSFGYIREREERRDRLFIIVVILLATTVLLLRYASALPDFGATVSIFGMSVAVEIVPVPALISLAWTLLALISVRYFQMQIVVEKQYDYLHDLEERLSQALGGEDIISRESSAYFTKKGSIFRHATWVFYLLVVPSILLVTSATAIVIEWDEELIPVGHKVYDSALAIVLVGSMILFLADMWWHREAD